jgi:hypothetical protein
MKSFWIILLTFSLLQRNRKITLKWKGIILVGSLIFQLWINASNSCTYIMRQSIWVVSSPDSDPKKGPDPTGSGSATLLCTMSKLCQCYHIKKCHKTGRVLTLTPFFMIYICEERIQIKLLNLWDRESNLAREKTFLNEHMHEHFRMRLDFFSLQWL